MKRAAILLIMAALFSAGAYAATVTPQRGGGISQFDGGISSSGGTPVTPTCANDAPDGNIDLSKCSNAIYLAARIL